MTGMYLDEDVNFCGDEFQKTQHGVPYIPQGLKASVLKNGGAAYYIIHWSPPLLCPDAQASYIEFQEQPPCNYSWPLLLEKLQRSGLACSDCDNKTPESAGLNKKTISQSSKG